MRRQKINWLVPYEDIPIEPIPPARHPIFVPDCRNMYKLEEQSMNRVGDDVFSTSHGTGTITLTEADLLPLVVVKSFQIIGGQYKRGSIHMTGTVQRGQASCKFELSAGNHTKLSFTDALIFDKSDPMVVALAVKQALLDYVRSSEYVPEPMRQHLMTCILDHSKKACK